MVRFTMDGDAMATQSGSQSDGNTILVFHGTSWWRSADIFWQGKLSGTALKQWDDSQHGFVYATNGWQKAVWYAAQATSHDGQQRGSGGTTARFGVVFVWHVTADWLEPDPEDATYAAQWRRPRNTPESQSFRVARDLSLTHAWWAWVNTFGKVRLLSTPQTALWFPATWNKMDETCPPPTSWDAIPWNITEL